MATSPALTPGDHFFEADGVRFHYTVVGTSGPLIVFQSVGLGMPVGWQAIGVGRHLGRTCTLVFFEPRGNGQSSRPADPATMSTKAMSADLEHLRAHLGLDAFPALMGGSNGAAIALAYAERHPERVRGLVLFSAQVMDAEPDAAAMQGFFVRRAGDPLYAESLARLTSWVGGREVPATDEEFAAGMRALHSWYFSDPARYAARLDADVDEANAMVRPSVYGLATAANDAKEENRVGHLAEAGRVTARTLIVWGEEDAMAAVSHGRALAEGIRGSRLVVVPGAGHCLWIEGAETLFAEVEAFVRS